ncbi:MAG: bifunctional YncE family protein/alkaline phosphatase family protein [Actinomycetota bacterium]
MRAATVVPRRRRRRLVVLVPILAVVLTASGALALTRRVPGPQPDGTSVTPEGWSVTPAGHQTKVGPGPMAVAASPRGNLVLVADGGYSDHALLAIDPATGSVIQKIKAPGGKSTGGPWNISWGHSHGYYAGLAFSPDGSHAWASDGVGSSLHTYTIDGRAVSEGKRIRLTDNVGNAGAYPAGIALSSSARRLYVVGNLDDTLYVVNTQTARVVNTVAVGHLPFGVALSLDGSRGFVSNWGQQTVSVVDTQTNKVIRTVKVGLHPGAIAASPTRNEIYVANSDSDSVSVLDGATGSVLRTIDLRPYPKAPSGGSPNAVAVSPDGSTLYVTNGGDNDVAVISLSGTPAVRGLIPTAWYPDAIAIDAASNTLFVTNMKGTGVGPNLDPTAYWISKVRGSLSSVPVPSSSQLGAFTQQVRANDAFDSRPQPAPGGVIPTQPGGTSPIKHVIYVMKENRTYDQVLGDLPKGNGDPSLAIYGQNVTPNQHELSSRFVTFDNFYADAEVSADGWSWTTAGEANDYIQRNWPLDYNGYGRPYDFGGFDENTTAGIPEGGYLFDSLARAGVDFENFGFFMDNPVKVPKSMPNLVGHTDPKYIGWDLLVPDQTRIDRWLHVFQGYEQQDSMPTMQFVYLPSDHTYATTQHARKPSAYVADNDLALGKLVDAVSHSQFWGSTAIFAVEDDAQDGPDHVDAHRSTAYVISPYTQTGKVDSTLYSSVSVLRTMELLLGVPPMSRFDAAANPMDAAFSTTPNMRPFTATDPTVSLTATNGPNTAGTKASAKIDFEEPDRIPMGKMNRILWKAARGKHSTMPAPVHTMP